MSIGAGDPKFRILAVRSAGWKVNTVPGNRADRSWRSMVRSFHTGVSSSFRAMVMSQSCVPMVGVGMKAWLCAPSGRPQFSIMLSTLPGNSWLTRSSTSDASRPATSIRVPRGARMCIWIVPDLVSGKKSRPATRYSPSEQTETPRKMPTNRPRLAIARSSTPAYPSRKLLKPRSNACWKRSGSRLGYCRLWTCGSQWWESPCPATL